MEVVHAVVGLCGLFLSVLALGLLVAAIIRGFYYRNRILINLRAMKHTLNPDMLHENPEHRGFGVVRHIEDLGKESPFHTRLVFEELQCDAVSEGDYYYGRRKKEVFATVSSADGEPSTPASPPISVGGFDNPGSPATNSSLAVPSNLSLSTSAGPASGLPASSNPSFPAQPASPGLSSPANPSPSPSTSSRPSTPASLAGSASSLGSASQATTVVPSEQPAAEERCKRVSLYRISDSVHAATMEVIVQSGSAMNFQTLASSGANGVQRTGGEQSNGALHNAGGLRNQQCTNSYGEPDDGPIDLKSTYLSIHGSKLNNESYNFRILLHLGDLLSNLLTFMLMFVYANTERERGDKAQTLSVISFAAATNLAVWAVARLCYMLLVPWLEMYGAIDALNSVCQRKGITYLRETRVEHYFKKAHERLGKVTRAKEWHTLLWLAPADDERRSAWCKQPGLGLQYCQAITAYEESLGHLANAAVSLYTICGVYTLGILSAAMTIVIKKYTAELPPFILAAIVGLLGTEVTLTAAYIVQFASSVVKAQRAVNLLSHINNHACIIERASLKKYVARVDGFWNYAYGMLRREFKPAIRVCCTPTTVLLVLYKEKTQVGKPLFLKVKVTPTHRKPSRTSLETF